MRHIDLNRIGKFMISVLLLLSFVVTVRALGLGTFETELRYTPDEAVNLEYYVVNENEEIMTVTFEKIGDLADYTTFDVPNYWYSTKSDNLDIYLEREVDLTNVSSATLKFYTKFVIEYGWDFGYVRVSTNNGSTWTELAGTSTTTYRDAGATVGVPGSPAYTGTLSSWTLQTIDLTAYAGQKILLRFWYVTDVGYTEHGWRIDDITIPDIGFSDDVQGATTDWTVDGWVKDVIYIEDAARTTPFNLTFVIPDSYQNNGSANKLAVIKVAGKDGGWNPTYGSAPKVIVQLPPLVKVAAASPAPSGGGGGGGGGGVSEYVSESQGVVTAYLSSIYATHSKNIDMERFDIPVYAIILDVKRNAQSVKLKIEQFESSPQEIKIPLDNVYKYLRIDAYNLDIYKLDEATIRFRIPAEWVDENAGNPEGIVMSHWTGLEWDDLPTTFTGQAGDEYAYDAATHSFSVFAIRVDEPIPEQDIILPAPTEKPSIDDMEPILVVVDNETANQTVQELVDMILRKTNTTEADLDDQLVIIPREQPTVQQPKERIANLITLFILLVILLVIAGLLIRVIVKGRNLNKDDSNHSLDHNGKTKKKRNRRTR